MPRTSSLEDIIPLSPLQEGLMFAGSTDPEGPDLYVVSSILDIDGDIDPRRLRSAAQALLDRHTSLRTCFRRRRDGRFAGLVARTVEVPWQDLDLSAHPAEERATAWARELDLLACTRFDLATPPLVRFALCRMDTRRWKLALVFHHAIIDGWSTPIVVRELFAVYAGDTLPPAAPYKNFLNWIQRQDREEAAAVWRRQLSDVDEPTLLAPPGSTRTARGTERVSVAVSPEVRDRYVAAARSHGVTPSTLLQCAWALVLARTLGRRDVVFGATVSGRAPEVPGVEAMVGLFINTVPVRVTFEPTDTVSELLSRTQRAHTAVMNHQYVSLTETTTHSGVAELFDTLMIYESYPVDSDALRDTFERSALVLSGTHGTDRTNFPVTVFAGLRSDGLDISLAYSPDVIDAGTAGALARRLSAALSSLSAGDGPVREIDILTGSERSRTVVDPIARLSRHHEFDLDAAMADCAAHSPHSPALVSGSAHLTYGELDHRVAEVAARLHRAGATRGDTIAIAVHRSIDLVVGLFAAMRTGAAYLPVDPSHPGDRLEYILSDAGVRFLLAHNDIDVPVSAAVARLDILSSEGEEKLPARSAAMRHPEDTAYLIYTSGTTGNPKGVVVTSGALANFAEDMAQRLTIDARRSMLAVTTVSFDIAVLELIVPISRGALVVIATDEEIRDPHAVAALAERHRVNIIQATPSWWASVLAATDPRAFPHGVDVLVGGEALPSRLAADLVDRSASVRNMYGPTETTIWSTTSAVHQDCAVDIGSPIAGTSLRVLDHSLTPSVPGAPGELYIGGTGLAQGYHNRAALTATRFVADPFGSDGTRIYRTSDLVSVKPSGALVYLARADNQMKIRGYRIEPGEIETALENCNDVTAAVVVARPDAVGTDRLVAYVVGNAVPSSLRTVLQRTLPAYMVPSLIVCLDSLPRTTNGKIDRKALPEPDFGGRAVRAPRDDRERVLLNLFAEILAVAGVDELGIDDDFFELGGHSLSATRLNGRIATQLGAQLPVRDIFDHPTVAQLARRLSADSALLPPITRAKPDELGALSFSQQRLWFLFHLEGATGMYNVPFAVRTSVPVDERAVRRALRDTADRHEVLRTVIEENDGSPIARVLPHGTHIELTLSDVEENALPEAVRCAADHPFDPRSEPPMRATLMTLPNGDSVFVLVLHHIATDEWSGPIILRDFADAYRSAASGLTPSSADGSKVDTVQYRDYALWQRGLLADLDKGPLAGQRQFWIDTLAGLPEEIALPTDRPRSREPHHKEGTVTVDLPSDLASALHATARAHRVTPFMFMHAATATLLAELGAGTDVPIGSPVSGRVDPALDSMVGMFVNTVVLRTDLSNNPSFATVLARVRETDLAALSHQDLPFDALVDILAPTRAYGRHPLFQVLVDYRRVEADDLADLFGGPTERIEYGSAAAKFDLAFALTEAPKHNYTQIAVDYSADLFDHETVISMTRRLVSLLRQVVASPEARLSDIDVTDGEDTVWRGGPVDSPPSIRNVMDHAAQVWSDSIAVVAGAQKITFAELDAASNRVARALLARGIRDERPVGVALPRSIETIVAFWALAKIGGVFVPLDLAYPPERTATMISDAGIGTVLVADRNFPTPPTVDRIDPFVIGIATQYSSASLTTDEVSVPSAEHALYVIFTSGSTGRPKGVMVPHRALAGLLAAYRADIFEQAKPGSHVLSMYSTSFDSSLALLLWMFDGHTLHLCPDEIVTDAAAVVAYVREHRIDHVDTVPAMMAALVDEGLLESDRIDVPVHRPRSVTVGGDAVRAPLWTRLAESEVLARNFYGPTENTVDSTFATITTAHSPNIGGPISGRAIAVLDEWLRPAPSGVTGELYVSGTGIARGYIGSPGLTATRFVADPSGSGSRMYRTGDTVRRRHDGPVCFVGRVDHQVKIRGYRIELGEVESALARCSGVREAVASVRVRDGEPTRLFAFVTGDHLDPDTLRSELAALVPEHMVPAHVEVLSSLPTTPNGKIDRSSLPEPDFAAAVSNTNPRSPEEAKICTVFARTLGLPAVGPEDDFFTLGGDSIVSIQVVSRLRAVGLLVTARQIFESRTPAALALVAAAATSALDVRRESATGEVPLTPIVWDAMERGDIPSRFCQARLLVAPQSMSESTLRAAVGAVLDTHHMLRSSFSITSSGPRWTVPEQGNVDSESCVRRIDLTTVADRLAAMAAAAENAYESIDPAAGRMMAVVFFDTGEDEPGRLLIGVHHLVMDGVSWRVLVPDLQAAFSAAQAGSAATLPTPVTSFRDWALSVTALATDDSVVRHLPWWTSNTEESWLGLHSHDTVGSTRTHNVTVSAPVTSRVLTNVPALFHAGVDDVLLTALALASARASGRSRLVVDLEGHGRSEHLVAGADLSRTVGWFTTIFPVPIDLSGVDLDEAFSGGPAAGLALKKTKDCLRAVPEERIGFGLLRYLNSAAAQSFSDYSAPDIVFNYLGRTTIGEISGAAWTSAPEVGPFSGALDPSMPLDHRLEINAATVDGPNGPQLQCEFSAAASVDSDTVALLTAGFLDALSALDAHAQNPDAGGRSSSDLTYDGLDLTELADLEAELDLL